MARTNEQVSSTVAVDDETELAHQGYRLLILSGELRGREVEIVKPVVTMGRSRQCEVVLPDDSVSRVHAEIRREGERYRLLDRESTAGTFLGGSRIKDAFLRPGDELRLGALELRFVPRDRQPELLPSEADRFGPVLGRSLAMRRVFAVLERVADRDVPVLIRGDTGTGKDLVARAIHEASGRREQPFVIVDCGALAADQIETELFGVRDDPGRRGAFALADRGTLLLDEVGELPADLQPKLLRVLESGRFRQVGGSEELAVDVRVLAASNRELLTPGDDEAFREDLYFRLAVVNCELPPLRERRDDIAMLIEAFSRRLPPGMWRPPGPEAMARLLGYDWPGNVRELRNVVERSAYLSPDGVIDLMASDRRAEADARVVSFDPTLTFREQKERAVERFEEAYLHWLLERAGGNISRGAREADMDRKYLHKLLRRYGIDAKQFASR
ncbi:sigma 54-interacting transcriptional regulator [Enhygromyxa salina]|uniref:Acetoin dehydrogenase operon transcriptional activator AcoR n=1 Tax=Enhygromyxa salina TaxID=215803 RepID=A0A2S9YMU2_9BACT|nr:sigma 54-interacting transcriptional regulator [Enhygromyxa salina]PRQ06405.1 Acetoin dehydrogenase operon transcriptional activator AcoR [Enhygromyxa salina]